ncbi:LacI family DNA-binding transcriptional regulator [Brachybacterium massiliense]|uniref:LacI family DNA-binding transcriptional regulator n=1 Tax=Brachybacterium massiliense TaxID=1755098 RepID=UPI000B3BAFAB|nr:LacI family DNA-binding transcriptional regulator [Brachybacterium massiliense]
MARRVSIKDVAQHAGVSWKTVSNVVNDRPVVREETRRRVERSIQELGYVPNRVGRDLRGGPTRTIALVVPELQNPYFARLAELMQIAARERGYTVSVEVSLGDPETERAHVRGLAPRPVDAVIISPTALAPADLLDADGPRVVLLGERLPAAAEISHVAIDNVASAVDVVHHLVEQGRERLLFLGMDGAVRSTATDRLAGFRAALRFAGREVEPAMIREVVHWDRAAGRREMEAVLAAGLEVDAVVAGNDLLALGALGALLDHGIDVPGQVAVVGWDDIAEAAWSRPALTTIAPDLQALITAALDAALTEGGEESAGSETVIAHRLVVRGTSVAPGGR